MQRTRDKNPTVLIISWSRAADRQRSATTATRDVMPTLILTPRYTEDSQALWRAAGELGWGVERLAGWRVPERVSSSVDPVLYVEGLLGPTVAKELGLRLAEPEVDWLPRLPYEYRKRRIVGMSLGEARQLTEPAFVKPPNDKSFPARVYLGSELPVGYDDASPVLVAEVVSWEVEFRCFVLNGRPHTTSIYERSGELQRDYGFPASEAEIEEAESFVQAVLADHRVKVCPATVLDVGVIRGRGWAVIEQNGAWGSGIYGCNPVRVLEVLRHAAVRAEPSDGAESR